MGSEKKMIEAEKELKKALEKINKEQRKQNEIFREYDDSEPRKEKRK